MTRVLACLILCCLPYTAVGAERQSQPNIIVILADDLGYGDVQCYNPERGKIATPNIDRLAEQGMRFTDAHSSSGVCSPTRYSILTGRYHWRTRLQSGIVGLWGKPLIPAKRMTIASLAKQSGYATACVGKWHLGWDWDFRPAEKESLQGLGGRPGGGGEVTTTATAEQKQIWKQIFSRPIPGGPTNNGFDYYFGTDVPNWPPYCFVENDRTVGIPSELMPKEAFAKNQASFQGPRVPGWNLADVLPQTVEKACSVIAKQAEAKKPFLLYVPLTAPHTPIAVAKEWQGKSELDHPYADFVMQTDAEIGKILKTIDDAKITDNTLVVLTSDNGCAPYIGAKDLEKKGHYPSGNLRGYKADAWEGGHRIPFIVRWPGQVKPNTVCDQTIVSVDLLATFAEVLGVKLPKDAGEDSVSILSLLKGETKPIHEAVVHQSSAGIFAIRSGPWKLIFGPGSGRANPRQLQLFHMNSDLAESKNLAEAETEQVAKLTAMMETLVANGRSTPGPKQENDVPVKIMK